MGNIVSELMWIYGSVAILGTIFLFLKQPVVIAYIFAGILLGPSVFNVVGTDGYMDEAAHLGIVLLMFLIGLNLKPADLVNLFKKTALLTLGTSIIFAGVVSSVLLTFGFGLNESIIAGVALMFSSTVIGFKLIPTMDLHNKRIGEVMISVLLFQDILAILIILMMVGSTGDGIRFALPLIILKATVFSFLAFLIVKKVIIKLFMRFDVIQEYIFIVSLGWCFLTAQVAHTIGLSAEIGAFIGGISLASSPIATIIAEHLKPIREFFLILFFFAIGAEFDIHNTTSILFPALVTGLIIISLKPFIFGKAFQMFGEPKARSEELGLRMGQASEFSLLVVATAISQKLISSNMESLIQMTTIFTFMISTYVVVLKYPTPISMDAGNRRD